jgi:hypothetical protein
VSPTFGNFCAPRQVVVRQGYCETTDRILHEIRGLETDMELLLVSCQSRTVCVDWSIPDWKINRPSVFFPCGKSLGTYLRAGWVALGWSVPDWNICRRRYRRSFYSFGNTRRASSSPCRSSRMGGWGACFRCRGSSRAA